MGSKRYFVTSDIHGFFDEFEEALFGAGFDAANPDHVLIVLGDIFDRGPKPEETYRFIRSLPRDQRMLVRGNHEDLILDTVKNYHEKRMQMRKSGNDGDRLSIYDMLSGGYFSDVDYSNGTVGTLCSLFHVDERAMANDCFTQAAAIEKFSKSNVAKWLRSDEWVDFLELGDYVLVHSFIPLTNRSGVPIWAQEFPYACEYNPDWRTKSTKAEIRDSRWGMPWQFFRQGLFAAERAAGKTLVCGHVMTSEFYNNLKGESRKRSDNPIYDDGGLIGLDACTALSHRVNVLVLDSDDLRKGNGEGR